MHVLYCRSLTVPSTEQIAWFNWTVFHSPRTCRITGHTSYVPWGVRAHEVLQLDRKCYLRLIPNVKKRRVIFELIAEATPVVQHIVVDMSNQ